MERDFEFEAYLNEGLEEKPLTIEEARARFGDLAQQEAQRERVAQIRRDGSAKVAADPFEVEQVIAQARVANHVTLPGRTFTPAGDLLTGERIPEPGIDPLMRQLEEEHEPDLGFDLERVVGRVTEHVAERAAERLAPGLHVAPGVRPPGKSSATPSILDEPLPEILTRVGSRASGGARALASRLATAAREGL